MLAHFSCFKAGNINQLWHKDNLPWSLLQHDFEIVSEHISLTPIVCSHTRGAQVPGDSRPPDQPYRFQTNPGSDHLQTRPAWGGASANRLSAPSPDPVWCPCHRKLLVTQIFSFLPLMSQRPKERPFSAPRQITFPLPWWERMRMRALMKQAEEHHTKGKEKEERKRAKLEFGNHGKVIRMRVNLKRLWQLLR